MENIYKNIDSQILVLNKGERWSLNKELE